MVGIQIKNDPHDFRLFLVDGQDAILFVIAVKLIVAQYMTILDSLPKTEFQSFRKLPHLVLGNTRHDDQPELAVGVQSIDVVILKENTHIVFQQFLGVLDTVQGRTGKPGDFLGDDKIKKSGFRIPDHAVEFIPLLCAGTGNALIYVPRNKGPVFLASNQLRVILHLVFQGV